MTVVDVVILVLVALMALAGYARGFLVGVMALVGFLGGAFVGARIGPLVLSGGANSPYAPLFGLGGALIAGSLLGAIFEGVARRLRRFLWLPGLRLVDGLLGAVMTGLLGLGLVWIVGAVLLQTSNQFRLPTSVLSSITRSAILKGLNRALPPSGLILNALGHIDPLPSVNGRAAAVPAPDVAILRAHGVIAATPAVVQIVGQACGLDIEGSGWVAGPGLVVTNAHVVAGETDTTVKVARPLVPGARARLRPAQRHRRAPRPRTERSSIDTGQRASVRRIGRDPRISAGRPLRAPARAARPDRAGLRSTTPTATPRCARSARCGAL